MNAGASGESGAGGEKADDFSWGDKVSRQKLRCLSCGRERLSLDEAIGLRRGARVTVGVRERALWLATEMAYDRASLGMEKLCGISISDGTTKNLVVEEGTEIVREKEEERNKDYFPEATYVLDFWHLARNIKVSLGAERQGLMSYLLSLAARGNTELLLRRLGELRISSRDPTFRARLEELMTYVSHNREGIENASRVDFYGSGPVEKAVDVTICRRFKKRGMSWYVHKAYPLLALRLLKINGEWEKYWQTKGVVTV